MKLLVIFGLPGTGKTYVGKVFEKYFDYYFYDGDNDLTDEMKAAIKTQKVFTDEMRDAFFKVLISKIQDLGSRIQNLVVAQTFIKEKYRMALIDKIPDTKFVLVETDSLIREKRLSQRKETPLKMEYARKMVTNFEKPKSDYLKIINNIDGDEGIKKQINSLLRNIRG